MRWLLGLVVVAAIGAAGWFWMRSRGEATKQVATTGDGGSEARSAGPQTTPTPPPPALAESSEQQEQGERKLVEDFAGEQKLTTVETDKVLASLKALQNGRRQLFIDLKDRRIAIEDLSKRLRELRTAMKQSFATELGDARAQQLLERFRVAHGGETTSSK